MVVVVAPEGPLRTHATTVIAMVDEAVRSRARTVVMDLGSASGHSGADLAVLMRCAVRASLGNARITLVGAGSRLTDALDRTCLTDVVPVALSLADAAVPASSCRGSCKPTS